MVREDCGGLSDVDYSRVGQLVLDVPRVPAHGVDGARLGVGAPGAREDQEGVVGDVALEEVEVTGADSVEELAEPPEQSVLQRVPGKPGEDALPMPRRGRRPPVVAKHDPRAGVRALEPNLAVGAPVAKARASPGPPALAPPALATPAPDDPADPGLEGDGPITATKRAPCPPPGPG